MDSLAADAVEEPPHERTAPRSRTSATPTAPLRRGSAAPISYETKHTKPDGGRGHFKRPRRGRANGRNELSIQPLFLRWLDGGLVAGANGRNELSIQPRGST